MIIYHDLISGDEILSDARKIEESADGLFFNVQGKMVTVSDGISDELIGGNKSAEEVDEGTADGARKVLDIIDSHQLVETSFDKKSFMTYLKGYMKALQEKKFGAGKLEDVAEEKKAEAEKWQTAMKDHFKGAMSDFKEWQFFLGESMNPDGMVIICKWADDGSSAMFTYFKDGLEAEKV